MKKHYQHLSDFPKSFLIALFVLYLYSGTTYATVYNVTSTADGNGLNQLRGALIDAGNNPGTHTINVSAGTYYIDNGHISFGSVHNCNITINGAGAGGTIIDARRKSRGFLINHRAFSARNNVEVTFSNLTIQNCLSTDVGAGGAIRFLGGLANILSLENCILQNNIAYSETEYAPGGAILSIDVTLNVNNCTFFNNSCNNGPGGAIRYQFQMGYQGISSGGFSIRNSIFSFNSTPGESSGGGAFQAYILGTGGAFSGDITGCSFTNNSAANGIAGAIQISNILSGATLAVNYNRFSGNSAGPNNRELNSAVDFFQGTNDVIDAKNNWWGCNEGAQGCGDTGTTTGNLTNTFTPHLQVKTTVNASAICIGAGITPQITTGFTTNSANEPIAASSLHAMVGLNVGFHVGGGVGSATGAQTKIQSNGLATANFFSNGSAGIASIYSSCDGTSSRPVSMTVNGPGSWLGTSSTNWGLAANWCGGIIPTSGTNVNIPSGTPYAPTISSTNAIANNITIASGASLTLAAFAVLHVKGALINNGAFNAGASGSITAFSGTVAQTIPGGDYATLAIDGGINKTLDADVRALDGFMFSGNTKLLLGDHTLTLETGAPFTGSNASSYIVTNGRGGVRKKNLGLAGFTFPIGLEASISVVRVTNEGTPDHITARVGGGVYTSYVNDEPQGSPITEKGVDRTWYISEETPGESNAIITVGWTEAAELSSFVRTNCFISHYESNRWDFLASTQAIGANPYYLSRSGVTSFSPFAVVNPDNSLPVILSHFEAKGEGNTAVLSWATTEEFNSERFEIERSLNGKNWQKIGSVSSSGESAILTRYRFVDEYPVRSQPNLYRLHMVDRDGTFAYSSIKSLKFGDLENSVVFPNPVSDKLFVRDFSQAADVRILDTNGKLTYQSGPLKTEGISVNRLSAGIHLVEINWLNGTKTVHKILVAK